MAYSRPVVRARTKDGHILGLWLGPGLRLTYSRARAKAGRILASG